jgi:hypothetical protein
MVGWVERISVTQQTLINVGFRSSTQPTLNLSFWQNPCSIGGTLVLQVKYLIL